jgi:hypothetical protein
MFKILFTSFLSLALGIVGTLYTTNWQEEKLLFSFGEIAQFGDITYQNIRIRNDGWNPATNVIVQLNSSNISAENIKASPKFDLPPTDSRVGGYERIRRNEVVTLSFAFKGNPITPAMLTVKSDRSIAEYQNPSEESQKKIDWSFVMFMMTVASFIIGLFSAIAIPAYQNYIKKAKEAQDRMTSQLADVRANNEN